ncbi:MAG TPA: DUF6520 family protein [Puia sp.]|jgi:hypothetical protein|nr:DUF6520 family protein [Puia sp.]
MKKLKIMATVLAFSVAIFGAFAFNSREHAKKFNQEVYEKSPTTHLCTIDEGSTNCSTNMTLTPCQLGTTPLFDNSCNALYRQP